MPTKFTGRKRSRRVRSRRMRSEEGEIGIRDVKRG
jgi:hypothetical protein